jgi:DNA-binding transcriptional regulator YiaG
VYKRAVADVQERLQVRIMELDIELHDRDIGAELLAARTQSGLSQSAFARAAGVSVRTLQEWEQGRKASEGTP